MDNSNVEKAMPGHYMEALEISTVDGVVALSAKHGHREIVCRPPDVVGYKARPLADEASVYALAGLSSRSTY